MPPERRTDDAALLELVGNLGGLLELDDLHRGLIAALRRLIPSDRVSINGVGPRAGDAWGVADPPVSAKDLADWARLGHQNPLAAHFLATGDGSARRLSDVATAAELHATELYAVLYRRIGLTHQLAFTLPAEPGRIIGVALSRHAGGIDYTDAERDLANRARPFLVQAYRTALAFARLRRDGADRDAEPVAARLAAVGLTAREAQIVALVARGRANARIAAELGLSPRTVDKHLERAFRKLGVASRSDAAARAWALADGDA